MTAGTGRLGPVARIVSGGQTGVDRAALELAERRGIAVGGWVPAGGWAEDAPTPPGVRARFPDLVETGSADPAERTRRNVRDADATLVLVLDLDRGAPSPGTDLTIAETRRRGHPLLVVGLDGEDALAAVVAFVAALPAGSSLVVAGPRESEAPGVHAAASALLAAVADALDAGPLDAGP